MAELKNFIKDIQNIKEKINKNKKVNTQKCQTNQHVI